MLLRNSISYFFLLFLTFTTLTTQAQSALEKAERHYSRKDYRNAFPHYKEGVDASTADAKLLFRAGFAAMQELQYALAAEWLARAYEIDANADPYLEYHLGFAYSEIHEYSRAINHLRSYREKTRSLAHLADKKIQECIIADSLFRMKPRTQIEPVEEFNTPFDEIAPLLSRDDRFFIFTSNRSVDANELRNGTNFEDVYIAFRNETSWTEPEKISPVINVKPKEAAVWLSADGKTILLYYEDGQGDIFQSDFIDGAWTRPKRLNSFINKPDSRESGACISPDGQRLYFASNRPGGRGGFDLYVSQWTGTDWGRPSNLGSKVNTRGNEEYPYIHSDGTLFFSSDGHLTLGGFDIFRTREENGAWTSPENLGYPINSAGFDGYFVLSEDGKTGYFASRRDGPDINLYRTTSPSPSLAFSEPEPEPEREPVLIEVDSSAVAMLRGQITDAHTTKGVQAMITVTNHLTDSSFSIATDTAGYFNIALKTAGDYGVTVISNRHLPGSIRMKVDESNSPVAMNRNISIDEAKVGSKVILRNVFFDTNEHALKPEAYTELKKLADLLHTNKNWKIQINGHTDNVGERAANLALSLRRAQSVVDYLVSLNIPRERLQARGFGPDRPIVSNDDEIGGREINRRTEIEITALD